VPWRPRLKAADDVRFFGNDVEKEFCEQAGSSDQVAKEEYFKWKHVWDAFSD